MIKELKKSSNQLESKIKLIISDEKKKLNYYIDNIGKYLDNLRIEEESTSSKKASSKKTTKRKK